VSPYKGRRVFRNGPGWVVLYVALTGLFAAGALFTYRQNGWTWVSIGMTAATVILGPGSIIESLVLRIELTDDALVATDLRGSKRYDIAAIAGIEEAKGCPPALLFKDGSFVKLPSVGHSVGNSVRSWLKHSESRSRDG
jgi:hypothetical protein